MRRGDIWKIYRKWPRMSRLRQDGYTLLLMVPGDLPVFLKAAMDVCGAQDMTHCAEVLVIPDQRSEAFRRILESYKQNWQGATLRLIELNPLESLGAKLRRKPGINHWLQIVRGISAARTTHALLHDADLFISDKKFLRRHYELCKKRRLACLGVSPAWDQWFTDKGYGYLTATWELMVEIPWVQSWEPWVHRGQFRQFAGEDHMFDTLYWAQCHSDSSRIGRHEGEHGFVHFNYVISTYRFFQQSKTPYEDSHFRLLLVRLLITAFDDGQWVYEVPEVDELSRGLKSANSRVTYLEEETHNNYENFRDKFEQLLCGGQLNNEKISRIRSDIEAFDQRFSWFPRSKVYTTTSR